MLSNRIDILELTEILGYSDAKYTKKWCVKNEIYVLDIGKNSFVNRIEYELIIERPYIEHLKQKHPLNWGEIYSSYKENKLNNAVELIYENKFEEGRNKKNSLHQE